MMTTTMASVAYTHSCLVGMVLCRIFVVVMLRRPLDTPFKVVVVTSRVDIVNP